MKAFSLFLTLCVAAAWTQTAPPIAAPGAPVAPQAAAPAAEKGDTVIAIFDDGVKMTVDEFAALVPVVPVPLQQMAQQDRERFLHIYGMYRKAAALAKSQKLDQKQPYKGSLDFTILAALADFAVKEAGNSITIDAAEVEKFYSLNKEPYKQIKVSGLKVAFGGPPAASGDAAPVMASKAPKKVLTEEEAKAKAEKLVAQIRAGADFVKMVQLESDDDTSKAKAGELGTWKMTDNVPDAMRASVFGLKPGEVSNPVRQPGGYYIFHADSIVYTPLAEVRDAIFAQLRDQHSREWMQNFDKNTKVEFPNKK